MTPFVRHFRKCELICEKADQWLLRFGRVWGDWKRQVTKGHEETFEGEVHHPGYGKHFSGECQKLSNPKRKKVIKSYL